MMSRALIRKAVQCNLCSNIQINCHLGSRGSLSALQYVNKSTKCDHLGQTLILLEDGTNIRELPIIVRKVSNNSILFCENKVHVDGNADLTSGQTLASNSGEVSADGNCEVTSTNDESNEIMDYFNKCYSARGIFAILETIPANEVTPHVALHALKRIVTLENNKAVRNASMGELDRSTDDVSKDGLHENETFTRTAVLAQLVDKILLSNDGDVLLRGFLIVNRDIIGKYIDQENKDRFTNEILCRVTDGKFSISQTCEAIKVFSDIKPTPHKNVDKLWVGITEKSNCIDASNLMDVIRSLPYLDKSRKVVLSVVEKKLFDFWYTINGHDVAEILVILKSSKSNSPRTLSILSQWVNKNIHTATEDDLIEIINGFCSIDYSSAAIDHALERYVKAKGVSIKNPALMASIADYCAKFRIRSPTILQGAAEYIVVHAATFSPTILQRLFLPLGILNYHPSNGFNFWKVLETTLEEKFVQFRPEEAIDMLVNCVYLKKYPLNFVSKVFNPYFLDRLHSYKNRDAVIASRSKLQILDIAMTLECAQYQGPVLPSLMSAPPIWQDGRIKRMTNFIRNVIDEVAGGPSRVAYNIIPAKMPPADIYVIDALLLNKSVSENMWPRFINIEREYNMHTAVVIHSQDHYCSDGKTLIGRQDMRIRHLKHLGLKVATMNLEDLSKLRVHPRALRKYIEERLSLAEPPFPKQKAL